MNVLEDFVIPLDGGHYREVAVQLRHIACQCRHPIARQEILNLAFRYDQRGNHFDIHAMRNCAAQT
jgi:hypothetical protein